MSSKVRITKEFAVEKSTLLYSVAVPVLLAAEYEFLQLADSAYNQARAYEDAGLTVPESLDLKYILWGLLAFIGPPALLWKTLEMAEDDRMGSRLDRNCPNF